MDVDIQKSEGNGVTVIRVQGEVDLNTSPQVRKAITGSIPGKDGALAIDLSGVPYMDSSGVATLIEGLREAGKTGANFMLVAPTSAVMKVLQLARIDSLFDIRESV
jgi:anti-sigma B factor antagonist